MMTEREGKIPFVCFSLIRESPLALQ